MQYIALEVIRYGYCYVSLYTLCTIFVCMGCLLQTICDILA